MYTFAIWPTIEKVNIILWPHFMINASSSAYFYKMKFLFSFLENEIKQQVSTLIIYVSY